MSEFKTFLESEKSYLKNNGWFEAYEGYCIRTISNKSVYESYNSQVLMLSKAIEVQKNIDYEKIHFKVQKIIDKLTYTIEPQKFDNDLNAYFTVTCKEIHFESEVQNSREEALLFFQKQIDEKITQALINEEEWAMELTK